MRVNAAAGLAPGVPLELKHLPKMQATLLEAAWAGRAFPRCWCPHAPQEPPPLSAAGPPAFPLTHPVSVPRWCAAPTGGSRADSERKVPSQDLNTEPGIRGQRARCLEVALKHSRAGSEGTGEGRQVNGERPAAWELGGPLSSLSYSLSFVQVLKCP